MLYKRWYRLWRNITRLALLHNFSFFFLCFFLFLFLFYRTMCITNVLMDQCPLSHTRAQFFFGWTQRRKWHLRAIVKKPAFMDGDWLARQGIIINRLYLFPNRIQLYATRVLMHTPWNNNKINNLSKYTQIL